MYVSTSLKMKFHQWLCLEWQRRDRRSRKHLDFPREPVSTIFRVDAYQVLLLVHTLLQGPTTPHATGSSNSNLTWTYNFERCDLPKSIQNQNMSSEDNKVEGSEPITIRVRDQVSSMEREGWRNKDVMTWIGGKFFQSTSTVGFYCTATCLAVWW